MSLPERVTIHIGNKSYKAKKGETFYLIPNKSHYLKNPSKTPAQVLWISSPPSF